MSNSSYHNCKWYRIGIECKIKIKFYLLPHLKLIHLKKFDNCETIVYNTKYVFAENEQKALKKYKDFHYYNLDIYGDIINALEVLEFRDLKESSKFHEFRRSAKINFAKFEVIHLTSTLYDKPKTITPLELLNKCSIEDFAKFLRVKTITPKTLKQINKEHIKN